MPRNIAVAGRGWRERGIAALRKLGLSKWVNWSFGPIVIRTLFGHTENLYDHQFLGKEPGIIDFRKRSKHSVLRYSEVRLLRVPLSASR